MIMGQEPLAIAHAVSDVFQQAGFRPLPLPENTDFRLEFERPGTGMDTVLYGDWESNKVWYRAKVRIITAGGGAHVVSCNAFRILEHGNVHFEVEHKLGRAQRGAYQRLLDQVRAHLNGAAL